MTSVAPASTRQAHPASRSRLLLEEPGEPAVSVALRRATGYLAGLQHEDGWWKGELETNVTMDAEDLLLREFLGIRTPEQTAATARWIRSRQRPDGTWANSFAGPPDLSTTVEAYLALRLAGDPASAPHLSRAARYVRDSGGVECSRVFTRIWLALFGLWGWDRLPVLPPEVVLLPTWAPLNIYDFGCWARQTVVALTIVGAHRPVRPLPFGIDELRGDGISPGGMPPDPIVDRTWRTWAGRFQRLDEMLHRYERLPHKPFRKLALARAERWILHRQEADGSWGGIQPPWVYSLMALHLQGYPIDHPVMAAGLAGIDRFTIEDEKGRRIEACQSPVWDTALAVIALTDAGVAPDDPIVCRAAHWLAGQEIRSRGDWSVRRPGLDPGGWAFEFANEHYPDIDDTAEVGMALRRTIETDGGAVERALAWVLGMQCSDGGWAAFDVDNTRTLCTELPFCDFGALIDPPSADVTAHVVEWLASLGRDLAATDRGVEWLLAHQEADGSWFGRWGANHLYGTGAVVPALIRAGVPPTHPSVRRAVGWLTSCQNEDGGWGEDLRSYRDPAWRGRGSSTPSQTAWALLALVAAGGQDRPARRGIEWLITHQRPDGGWDEPWFTGTGFPGDFYINYHLYRIVFPMMALGRYLHRAGPAVRDGIDHG